MPRRPLFLRIMLITLACVLAVLQIRLWVSADGFRGVQKLQRQVAEQEQENAELTERNQRLEAEVRDLKKGFVALEERARSDLGLIVPGETFYVIGETAGEADSSR